MAHCIQTAWWLYGNVGWLGINEKTVLIADVAKEDMVPVRMSKQKLKEVC